MNDRLVSKAGAQKAIAAAARGGSRGPGRAYSPNSSGPTIRPGEQGFHGRTDALSGETQGKLAAALDSRKDYRGRMRAADRTFHPMAYVAGGVVATGAATGSVIGVSGRKTLKDNSAKKRGQLRPVVKNVLGDAFMRQASGRGGTHKVTLMGDKPKLDTLRGRFGRGFNRLDSEAQASALAGGYAAAVAVPAYSLTRGPRKENDRLKRQVSNQNSRDRRALKRVGKSSSDLEMGVGAGGVLAATQVEGVRRRVNDRYMRGAQASQQDLSSMVAQRKAARRAAGSARNTGPDADRARAAGQTRGNAHRGDLADDSKRFKAATNDQRRRMTKARSGLISGRSRMAFQAGAGVGGVGLAYHGLRGRQ